MLLVLPKGMKKIYTIGACLKAESNPFWSIEVRNGLEDASKELFNVKLRYQSPERITDLKKQKAIINSFVKKGVDCIVLAPSDPVKLVSSVKAANKAGIPVIVIDSQLQFDEVEKQNVRYFFVGFDDYRGGYETGLLLRERLEKSSSVAVIAGYPRGSYARRVDGFRDAVQRYLKITAIASANFEEDEAYRQTKRIITPDLRAIFCTSDNMAMGCLTALNELNRPDIIVCGFDATHAGKLTLQRGKLLSTVDTGPEKMGYTAVKTALDMLEGKKPSREIELPIKLLTREKLTSIPKQVFHKRTYCIVEPKTDQSEFNYPALHELYECPIVIGNNLFTDIPPRLAALDADRYYIITDNVVKHLYGDKLRTTLEQSGLKTDLFAFPAGEHFKTFTTLNNLALEVLDKGLTKRSCLVLLGGGVVGNIAGFLAAILMRGIRFVHVPTTVMAQIDSTTGGKQAVNTRHGKNLLGTYYEPEFIYIDPSVIKTLPQREYNSGMAEAIKHGLCQSRELLRATEQNDYAKILRKTIELKIHLIDADPREKREGLALMYGHTIGHALETATNHTLNHGEAISIGMMAAAHISYKLGLCNKTLINLHEQTLRRQGLPVRIPKSVAIKQVLEVLLYDKKERKTHIPFVLLENIGKIKTTKGNYQIEVEDAIIKEVLRKLQE